MHLAAKHVPVEVATTAAVRPRAAPRRRAPDRTAPPAPPRPLRVPRAPCVDGGAAERAPRGTVHGVPVPLRGLIGRRVPG